MDNSQIEDTSYKVQQLSRRYFHTLRFFDLNPIQDNRA